MRRRRKSGRGRYRETRTDSWTVHARTRASKISRRYRLRSRSNRMEERRRDGESQEGSRLVS